MTRTLQFTDRADAEIDRIADYTYEAWGKAKAIAYQDELLETMRMLLTHPAAGRARQELGDGVRSFPVGRHLIYYRPADEAVLVLSVQHQASEPDPNWDALS